MKKNHCFIFFLLALPISLLAQIYDFEGNRYDTVKIGNQVWLKQNVRSKKYFDGKIVESNNYRCPNGDCSKSDSFGLLYNFNGLSNGEVGKIIKGICPNGYAIPTPENWHELMLFLNADTTYLWKNAYNNVKYKVIDTNRGGTGETDLSVLPSGINIEGIYNGFGELTNIRLIDSNTHKSIFIAFDGGSAGTINVYNLAPGLVKSNTYYQSCRCIKSSIVTASKDVQNSSDWVIYPNPSIGEFAIYPKEKLNENGNGIEVISLNGHRTKLSENANGYFSINHLPSGIYFVKISNRHNSKFLKIIKL